MKIGSWCFKGSFLACLTLFSAVTQGQTAPSDREAAGYTGLHAAAYAGESKKIQQLAVQGSDLEIRDGAGRTAVHVAAYQSHDGVLKALIEAGGDINAFENDAYDVVTIAAVANDLKLLRLALSLGGNPGSITSPYEGTALIAAAHLGHVEVVRTLIEAGAPLDHINNLGWTALIEVIVLGEGGTRHIETARALIEAGANTTITDRDGYAPIDLARQRGFKKIVALFTKFSK
jgi:ankyrin repeat protein